MNEVHDGYAASDHKRVLDQKTEVVSVRFICQRTDSAINCKDGDNRKEEGHHPDGTVTLQFIEKILHHLARMAKLAYETALA